MNKLYLRIPPMHAANWPNGSCAYVLCSKDGAILREGHGTIAELASDINKTKVTVLIAATDVNLLALQVPDIPEAKLKLALPTLVEDSLIGESSDCILALLHPSSNGVDDRHQRVVAIVQREGLQQLSSSLYALGASFVKALPAQLCLPFEEGYSSVYVEGFEQDAFTHYSVRTGINTGAGVLLEAPQSIDGYLAMVAQLSPPGPIRLQLPFQVMNDYQTAIDNNPDWSSRITVHEINWTQVIDAAAMVTINLMSGLSSAQYSRLRWQIWRWPVILGALTVLVNVVSLNIDYWSLKREANALKMGIAQTFKKSFPKDTVAAFPLEQMKKKLQIARRDVGLPSPSDFTVLLTGFGSAWGGISPDKLPKIASIDYKDGHLFVQVKGNLPEKELQETLSGKALTLKKSSADIWEVGPVKTEGGE